VHSVSLMRDPKSKELSIACNTIQVPPSSSCFVPSSLLLISLLRLTSLAILIFCWLGITACRFYSSLYPEKVLPIWALGTSHFILNLQGFLNAFVFCSVIPFTLPFPTFATSHFYTLPLSQYRSVWNSWLKLFGIQYVPTRRTPITPAHRSFGQSHTSGVSNLSADTPPLPPPSRFLGIFPYLSSAATSSSMSERSQGSNNRGIAYFLFGIQSVRNPVSGRETIQSDQGKQSSTSYLHEISEESNNSSSEVDLDVIENPLNQVNPTGGSSVLSSEPSGSSAPLEGATGVPSAAGAGGGYQYPPTSIRPSRSSISPPLPPVASESPVSTRFLSSFNWLSTNGGGGAGGTGSVPDRSSRGYSSFSSSSKASQGRSSEDQPLQQQELRESSLSLSQYRGTTSSSASNELTNV
jgi:hypothetical protein